MRLQRNHCLEISFWCWSFFDAVYRSPEQKGQLYEEVGESIVRTDPNVKLFSKTEWQIRLTKTFNQNGKTIQSIVPIADLRRLV